VKTEIFKVRKGFGDWTPQLVLAVPEIRGSVRELALIRLLPYQVPSSHYCVLGLHSPPKLQVAYVKHVATSTQPFNADFQLW
jgi:hypothetical protein